MKQSRAARAKQKALKKAGRKARQSAHLQRLTEEAMERKNSREITGLELGFFLVVSPETRDYIDTCGVSPEEILGFLARGGYSLSREGSVAFELPSDKGLVFLFGRPPEVFLFLPHEMVSLGLLTEDQVVARDLGSLMTPQGFSALPDHVHEVLAQISKSHVEAGLAEIEANEIGVAEAEMEAEMEAAEQEAEAEEGPE